MRIHPVLLIALLAASPAQAALKVGDAAPDFTAPATLGGHEFTFSLGDALKKGPVVVYFYPAAFTEGCTIEAHEFAAAMGDFKAAGASVIGISSDDIGTLDKFSTTECRSKFPVAADERGKVMKLYDAAVGSARSPYADRISYVVGADGKIVFAYSDEDPEPHVTRTLAAVRKLKSP
jgi:peroxiredoxin